MSVPLAIQDLIMQTVSTIVLGYTLLLHIQLYYIYPVLVVVPLLMVGAVVHFVIQSGRGQQKVSRQRLLYELKNQEDDHEEKEIDRKKFVSADDGTNNRLTDHSSVAEDIGSDSQTQIRSNKSILYHRNRRQSLKDGLQMYQKLQDRFAKPDANPVLEEDSEEDSDNDDEYDNEGKDGTSQSSSNNGSLDKKLDNWLSDSSSSTEKYVAPNEDVEEMSLQDALEGCIVINYDEPRRPFPEDGKDDDDQMIVREDSVDETEMTEEHLRIKLRSNSSTHGLPLISAVTDAHFSSDEVHPSGTEMKEISSERKEHEDIDEVDNVDFSLHEEVSRNRVTPLSFDSNGDMNVTNLRDWSETFDSLHDSDDELDQLFGEE